MCSHSATESPLQPEEASLACTLHEYCGVAEQLAGHTGEACAAAMPGGSSAAARRWPGWDEAVEESSVRSQHAASHQLQHHAKKQLRAWTGCRGAACSPIVPLALQRQGTASPCTVEEQAGRRSDAKQTAISLHACTQLDGGRHRSLLG